MRSIVVRVEATPGASRERIEERGEHRYMVSVREPPQGGAANARIREMLALRFAVPIARVRMRTGARGAKKSFDVILEL